MKNTSIKPIQIVLPERLRPTCIHGNIRVGSKHDGGYEVNRNAVYNSDFLMSYGLSEDWRFEKEFLSLNKVPSHIYDHTVTTSWLLKNAIKNLSKLAVGRYAFKNTYLSFYALFTYHPFFREKRVKHFLEKISKESFQDLNEISLLETFTRTSSRNIFLKIDIEGGEYPILDQILLCRDRVSALSIEFHNLDLFNTQFLEFINDITTDFHINSININNFAQFPVKGIPRVLEVSMSKCSEQIEHALNTQTEFSCVPNDENGPLYDIKFAN